MAVIRCLAPSLKELLLERTGDPRLHAVRECDDGSLIQIISGRREGGVKRTRAPSAYNEFIGRCVKEKGNGRPVTERFRECAADWKRRKK